MAGSRAIRIVNIPLPPQEQRLAAASHAVASLLRATGDQDPEPGRVAAAAEALMSATHGMSNAEVLAIGRMALDRGLPVEKLEEAAACTGSAWSTTPGRPAPCARRSSGSRSA